MSSIELENGMKQVLKYFHSEAGDATEQIRLHLDEMLRQTYGGGKALGLLLPQKYLDEERYNKNRIPSSSTASSGKSNAANIKSASSTGSSARDKEDEGTVMDNQLSLELLQEDLACTVCRQMSVQAGNRLVECEGCHALYHQDCHTPAITDSQMSTEWNCSACQVTPHTFAVSSLPPAKTSHPIMHPSMMKSPGKQPVPSSTSLKIPIPMNPPSKVITPNINIISADKRLQIMKKKAARQQENKRKHPK